MSPVPRQRLGSSEELESGESERETTESSTRSMTPSFWCLFSEWHIVARSTTTDVRDVNGMRSAGQHSIRFNDQERPCFRRTKAGAEEVVITDYQ
jgi:hypothetical protein